MPGVPPRAPAGQPAGATLRYGASTPSAVERRAEPGTKAGESSRTAGLLDDLGDLRERRRRDGQAEGLGSLQVDTDIDFCGALDRQIGGPGALQDLVGT